MATITIFGNGGYGQALDATLSKGGATIQHIVSSQKDEQVEGDLVILAVPYAALEVIADTYGEKLAGKVVVDITNPVDFDTFDGLTVDAGSSAAAELQAKIPAARVVKAFNTNFVATVASGEIAGEPTTVLAAGDDADAKATLIEAVTAAGLRGVDAGSLKRARELEALGFLQMTLAAGEKTSWTGGFALTK
ncbi:NADPH-dependent F420 reductase [Microbacterium indicum]|uniref:NADPH-dependent F420 reductase n=1 Tax=Microbacterium indicum TaxID=358100 RepID=UPI0004234DB7|nr:NAD(P)-binding domain-containing protein [Microbacterium indicum]